MSLFDTNIVKKTFDKIDEFKNANALAEQAKIKLAGLKSQIETIEEEWEEKEKILDERESDVKIREDAVIASEDRTRKKLEISIDELNEAIIKSKENIIDIDKKKKTANSELKQVISHVSTKNDDYDKAVLKSDKINSENIKVEKKLKDAKIDLNNAKDLKSKTNKETEILRKENVGILERKADLDLYARRIQRYYDEANIKIKI